MTIDLQTTNTKVVKYKNCCCPVTIAAEFLQGKRNILSTDHDHLLNADIQRHSKMQKEIVDRKAVNDLAFLDLDFLRLRVFQLASGWGVPKPLLR